MIKIYFITNERKDFFFKIKKKVYIYIKSFYYVCILRNKKYKINFFK